MISFVPVSLSAPKSPCLHIQPNSCGRLGFLDQTGGVKFIHININNNINIEQYQY